MNKLKWFLFQQNNSGGYFVRDENQAEYVFVQAHSAEEAKSRIEDKLDYNYCECCGARWGGIAKTARLSHQYMANRYQTCTNNFTGKNTVFTFTMGAPKRTSFPSNLEWLTHSFVSTSHCPARTRYGRCSPERCLVLCYVWERGAAVDGLRCGA